MCLGRDTCYDAVHDPLVGLSGVRHGICLSDNHTHVANEFPKHQDGQLKRCRTEDCQYCLLPSGAICMAPQGSDDPHKQLSHCLSFLLLPL